MTDQSYRILKTNLQAISSRGPNSDYRRYSDDRRSDSGRTADCSQTHRRSMTRTTRDDSGRGGKRSYNDDDDDDDDGRRRRRRGSSSGGHRNQTTDNDHFRQMSQLKDDIERLHTDRIRTNEDMLALQMTNKDLREKLKQMNERQLIENNVGRERGGHDSDDSGFGSSLSTAAAGPIQTIKTMVAEKKLKQQLERQLAEERQKCKDLELKLRNSCRSGSGIPGIGDSLWTPPPTNLEAVRQENKVLKDKVKKFYENEQIWINQTNTAKQLAKELENKLSTMKKCYQKELMNMKTTHQSTVTALKKQNRYFQNCNNLNKRKHLTTEYLYRRHQLMYKKSQRVLHRLINKNSGQCLDELARDIQDLIARRKDEIQKNNNQLNAEVVEKQWSLTDEYRKNADKMVNTKSPDNTSVQCPECDRKFANYCYVRKHLEAVHFIVETKIIDTIQLSDDE